MEITGRITNVGTVQTGVSKQGNNWSRQQFVVEYVGGQYPKSIALDTMDTNIIGKLQVGQEVNVKFDCTTREYNGKMYNDFHIWKDGLHCLSTNGQQAAAPQPTPAPVATPTPQTSSDLPF